uniref:Cytochrome P450 n=1 Tax=Leersia perrieri TaxID=77586 RepID=A0A0D9VD36_9ORYZ
MTSPAMAVDLPLHMLILLPLLAIPVLLLLRSRSSASRGNGGERLPPGPWALPIIGHLHHLIGRGVLPHRRLRDLARRHGPLMLLRLGEVQTVVASSAEAAREILKAHDLAFATRPMSPMSRLWFQGTGGGVVFAPYGDGWRQLRKICTVELFSHSRVASFRPIRHAEVGRLLRAVAAEAGANQQQTVNLTGRIASYVFAATVRAIIGSREFAERDAYMQMLKEMFRIVPGMSLPDLFPSSSLAMRVSRMPALLARTRNNMHRLMDIIIKEHQEFRSPAGGEEEEDLVDVLLRLQKEAGFQHPLTTQNIKFVMSDMFSAGSETLSTALTWAMAELMRNPRVRHKLQEEIRREFADDGMVMEEKLGNLRYLRMVIKETLRLHPPGPLMVPRECRTPCKVLGYDMPVGLTVLVNVWAISRDPVSWGDTAEEFLPERFEQCDTDFKGVDFEFIPFGAGRRICPGISMALANMELVLTALLFHFDFELPMEMSPKDMDMTEKSGLSMERKGKLFVVAVPRVPVPPAVE